MSIEITAPRVLDALSRHIGRGNGVSAAELVEEITGRRCPRSERDLRREIVILRLQGHHICGRPETGYYMARRAEELDDTCEFLYERAMTSLTQIAAMKRISLPDLRGQLKLPT